MSRTHRRTPLLCIVPPYIFESIARNGTAEQQARAADILAHDAGLREQRARGMGRPGPARGPVTPAGPPHKDRRIYTADNTTTLPGTLVRSEGEAAGADVEVNEAYDGLGATFDLYWDVFQRNSIDDAGMTLVGTVHYDRNYDNAYWDGTQMVFGDGDGTLFNRFTAAVDVIGHELTHGVTQDTAALEYQDQSGALNESVSDAFGSLVKQYSARPQQTAADADWLIGAGLLAPGVQGVALRSMKAPGTAYDDPVLGKDPQPAHMRDYVTTTSDNGGVHTNSGIPNHAFYLAAVALGGHAWEKTGAIWYATLRDSRLTSTATFADFANVTVENAAGLFGDAERQAVLAAWTEVGVLGDSAPTEAEQP
jgi:Zn-dependent metalloprotease